MSERNIASEGRVGVDVRLCQFGKYGLVFNRELTLFPVEIFYGDATTTQANSTWQYSPVQRMRGVSILLQRG